LVNVYGCLLAQMDLNAVTVFTCLKRDSNEGYLENYGSC
jgi:hypothetical protein